MPLKGRGPTPGGGITAILASRPFKVSGGLLLIANAAIVIGMVLRTDPLGTHPSDFWVINGLMIVPILACVTRAVVGGSRRAGSIWLALAMSCYAAGNVIFVGWTQFQATPPVPSPADVAYLLFYPCVAAAVVALLRSEEGVIGRRLWLDGSLGAAGAATALAAVLSPTLEGTGEDIGPVVVSAAFSVGDLLLIAMVFGVLAVRGLRGGSMWIWIGAGLATFCAADVAYALQVAAETFVVGTLWGTLWVLGLTIAAFGLWRPERPLPAELGRSTAMLAIPSLATLTAVVVLVISSFDPDAHRRRRPGHPHPRPGGGPHFHRLRAGASSI